MAESEDSVCSVWDAMDDDLIKELLDDQSPFFLVDAQPGSNSHQQESTIRNLISTAYSGPTIGDIQSALPTAGYRTPGYGSILPRTTLSSPEKGFGSRVEGKCTVRIKCSATGTAADDGYKWRKYGQKSIKNCPYPRSYYKCTNPRCNAKKQVEKSQDDPETLLVTYEGLHLHYTYPHLLSSRQPTERLGRVASPKPKKAKLIHELATPTAAVVAAEMNLQIPAAGKNTQRRSPHGLLQAPQEEDGSTSQGLLEDIVSLLVRNPSNDAAASADEEQYYCSYDLRPPSPLSATGTSGFPWSPLILLL